MTTIYRRRHMTRHDDVKLVKLLLWVFKYSLFVIVVTSKINDLLKSNYTGSWLNNTV